MNPLLRECEVVHAVEPRAPPRCVTHVFVEKHPAATNAGHCLQKRLLLRSRRNMMQDVNECNHIELTIGKSSLDVATLEQQLGIGHHRRKTFRGRLRVGDRGTRRVHSVRAAYSSTDGEARDEQSATATNIENVAAGGHKSDESFDRRNAMTMMLQEPRECGAIAKHLPSHRADVGRSDAG